MSPPASARLAEARALFKLAGPLAAAQAGIALMGVVDTAVVGRLGAAPLAAAGLGNGLFMGLGVIGLGAVMGLDPLFAQALGARDEARARGLVAQGLWLSLLVALALAVPIALAPLLLRPAGIPSEVAPGASAYIWLRLLGLWPMLAFGALRSSLQARGRTQALLVATVAANVANFLLDLVLVFGRGPIPALGAPGSALATALCSWLQFGIVLFAVRTPGQRVAAPPRWSDQRLALGIGGPVGLHLGAETLVFALVGLLAGRLGAVSLAAHQIAIALASFTFCGALGVGQAGAVRVGRAVGARDRTGTVRSGRFALLAGCLVMGGAALAFWLAPGACARLLTNQPAILAVAIPVLGVCAVFQLSDGGQAVGAGILRGAGDTRFALWANLAGHYGIGLPLAVLLGLKLGFGVTGLWWGLCAGLTAVALALVARFEWLAARGIDPVEAHGAATP